MAGIGHPFTREFPPFKGYSNYPILYLHTMRKQARLIRIGQVITLMPWPQNEIINAPHYMNSEWVSPRLAKVFLLTETMCLTK